MQISNIFFAYILKKPESDITKTCTQNLEQPIAIIWI